MGAGDGEVRGSLRVVYVGVYVCVCVLDEGCQGVPGGARGCGTDREPRERKKSK